MKNFVIRITVLIFFLSGCLNTTNFPQSKIGNDKPTPVKNPSATYDLFETQPNILITEYTELDEKADSVGNEPKITTTLSPSASFEDKESIDEGISLDGRLILFYSFSGEITLLDIDSGEIRTIDSQFRITPEEGFLGWANQGCSFYIRTHDLDIVEISISGQLRRKIFESEHIAFTGKGNVIPWVLISPSETYFAFNVGSGDRTVNQYNNDYHYETEDIYANEITQLDEPIKISENGKGWFYQWSPDGENLAYTDVDKNGYFQIFIWNINNNLRTQITNFLDEMSPPYQLIWSPNQEYIVVFLPNEGVAEVFIAKSDGSSVLALGSVRNMWWNDDGSLVLWDGKESILKWMDPKSGGMIRTLKIPESESIPKPFGSSEKIACLHDCFGHNDYGLVIFDIQTQKLERYLDLPRVYDYYNWVPSLFIFPGEAQCN